MPYHVLVHCHLQWLVTYSAYWFLTSIIMHPSSFSQYTSTLDWSVLSFYINWLNFNCLMYFSWSAFLSFDDFLIYNYNFIFPFSILYFLFQFPHLSPKLFYASFSFFSFLSLIKCLFLYLHLYLLLFTYWYSTMNPGWARTQLLFMQC